MKLRFQTQQNQGLTFIDVVIVIGLMIVLMVVIMPILARQRRPIQAINCVSNLKQVDLSFRIWEGDNNNEYPMGLSVTNGGAREWVATNNLAACYRLMSNELSTPKILICPADTKVVESTNGFGPGFGNNNISYFLNVDVTNEDHPSMVMIGDDNFQINGALVNSGLLTFRTNAPVLWGPGRHGDDPHRHFWTPPPKAFVGNLGFADGSVEELSDAGLHGALIDSGFATNRLAIP